MTRLIECSKLHKTAEGLNQPPLPGEFGQRIYENISHEAWTMWLEHQTMLINEYRLSMIDQKSRTFLMKEMENYLFGQGSDAPAGYVPKD